MMETVTKTDVIIVGAGPTGLSLAAQLIRYGIDFVIFDKKEGVTDLSKALVVHARTMEIYDQIGLAQTAVANGALVQKAALMSGGKIRARLDFSDFEGQLSPFPFFLAFEQSKNEHLLYEHLLSYGKDVQWQTELASLTQTADEVTAVLKTASGETQTIQARYLVGCDGASSPTRHLLDLHFAGSTHPRLFYVADVEMEIAADESTLYASFGRESFVLMFPMEGDKHWRLVGNMPEYNDDPIVRAAALGEHPDVTFEQIETKVKQNVQRPLEIANVRWFSTYKVHTRRAETFAVGRCFLAGDAAHVHTPAGGQGMNTGIQDVYNLAWKIAYAIEGMAGDGLLASYSEERVENAKHLLESTDRAFDVLAGEHWYGQLLRTNILPIVAGFVTQFSAAKEVLFPILSQIGINYRHSALSKHQGDEDFKVKAGDRMPYFLVDGKSVYDQLRAPKFHLVVCTEREFSYPDLAREIATEYSDSIDLTVIPLSPRISEIFGTNQSLMMLLRPDNYIGFISSQVSSAAVNDYLHGLAK